jgi:hypothetical protein
MGLVLQSKFELEERCRPGLLAVGAAGGVKASTELALESHGRAALVIGTLSNRR